MTVHQISRRPLIPLNDLSGGRPRPSSGVKAQVQVGAEDVPSSVELRWRPDDHQATFTVSS